MANVIHPQVDFHPRPVNHSPFGFGFGLSSSSAMAAGWPSPTGLTHAAPFHQLAASLSHSNSIRANKRRHEPEDEADSGRNAGPRDDAMDRSPTPERPKRAAPKRARVAPPGAGSKEEKTSKESKAPTSDENDVDVGVLLASLPPQSLLPLLTSLIHAHPSLKSTILPLIPRPTVDTAIQALALSAKKLRDAYPYSNGANFSSFSQPESSSTPSGFTSGFGTNRLSVFGSSTTAFGRPPNPQQFGQPAQQHGNANNGGMRDSYILSRLRPHITEFVAACMSYLPYFSYIPPSSSSTLSRNGADPPQVQSNAITQQTLHKDKSHPSETYLFLSALTTHLLSQPPLTQSSLAPLLLPRLSEEWKAWVDRVDQVVNQQGGMFGSETVKQWEGGLDEFAEAKGVDGLQPMRAIRDRWVAKVGWLVGRVVQHAMEEEL